MRELIEPYLWMPRIPLRFNAKEHQRNYCRLMKKSKWLGGRVACMTGNIIATKTFYRTTHRFCTVDVCHLNSSSLHSDATAQFCNRTTGARIVKVLLLWHPTILSCTLFGAFLCTLAQLPPGRGVWGCDSTCTGSWSQERHRRQAEYIFHSRAVLSPQWNILHVLQGSVDPREFKDWMGPRWKVRYCRRIEMRGSHFQCFPN